MTSFKDFLTGENEERFSPTPEMEKRVLDIHDDMLRALPEMKSKLVEVTAGIGDDMQTRTVNITMPNLFWTMHDKFTELCDLVMPGAKPDDLQSKIFSAFNTVPGLTTQDVLISQAQLEATMNYTTEIVTIELMYRFREALESGDTEALLKVMQRMKDDTTIAVPPTVDDDADPEN